MPDTGIYQGYGSTWNQKSVQGCGQNIYLVDDNIDLTLKYIRQYYAENAEAVFVKTIGNVDVYQITDDSEKKE